MGYVCFVGSVALLFTGTVIAVWVRFWKEPVWRAFLANQTWAWVHRWLGYFCLALGAATITSGGIDYAHKQAVNDPLITWSWIVGGFSWLSILLIEFFYQVWRRTSKILINMPKNTNKLEEFTPESFEHAVFFDKRRLMILDNLVLDLGSHLTGYAIFHPGGKFILEQNIGRDISKFFFGGYSMMEG